MFFDTKINLNLSETPGIWINYKNVYFNNGSEALNYYANTPVGSGTSEIIDASDDFELKCKMGDMLSNYMNQNYLNEHVYPYM